jgi:hypothetical protein
LSSDADEILDQIAQRTFAPGDEEFEERRRHPRFAFNAIQHVAPYVHGEMPAATAFQPVVCHDISCGGLSYYLNQPPIVKDVVLALSIRGQVKYLTAHILRTIVTLNDGGLKYLIGCRFIGRLDAV